MNIKKTDLRRYFFTGLFDTAEEATATIEDTSTVSDENTSVPDSIENYRGSEAVNPKQRPIKKVDYDMFPTKKAIDKLIRESGEDMFIPEDAIKKDEEKDKKDDNNPEEKIDKKDDKKIKIEFDEDDFYKESGFDKETFSSLPEATREKIVDNFTKKEDNESLEKIAESSNKINELNGIISEMSKDPTIAARLEEIKTGRKYVATDMPMASRQDIETLIEAAEDPKEFEIALNEYISKIAKESISVERSVSEYNAKVEKLNNEALGVIQEMIKREPRIGIKETDLSKIDKNHPEWNILYGEGGIFDIFKKMHYNLKQIVAKGPDRLLREISDEKGWTQETMKKIKNSGVNEFLEKVKKAAKEARTIKVDGKSTSSGATGSSGYDRKSLISDISSGKTEQWERLMRNADARRDIRMMNELNEIMEEGQSERKRKSKTD